MDNFLIKEWCSCIRFSKKIIEVQDKIRWVQEISAGSEGDIVLVEVLETRGAYQHIENQFGRDVKLYPGDIIACVLGYRKSGTKLSGSVPTGPIKKDRELELLSLGGIVGEMHCVPKYFGEAALKVKVVAMPTINEQIINTRTFQKWPPYEADNVDFSKLIWVGGTSAESGKTTFVSQGIFTLTHHLQKKVGAIKIVGTGRLSDMLCYKDSGAFVFNDYVANGWPSTYNMGESEFVEMLMNIVNEDQSKDTDCTFMEIGGDLMAGGAEFALDFCKLSKYPFYLMVNDAMGAMAGINILREKGVTNIRVGTFKQNAFSLAERLKLDHVLDISNTENIVLEFKNLYH